MRWIKRVVCKSLFQLKLAYQFKNGNMFMAVVSAVISVLLFALAIYNKMKSKESKGSEKIKIEDETKTF